MAIRHVDGQGIRSRHAPYRPGTLFLRASTLERGLNTVDSGYKPGG